MKRKTIVDSIIIFILIFFLGYFLKCGYDNHIENFTYKLYKGKVIHKHQAMSSGKYPSERLYFVIYIEEEGINYEIYYNIETWYKYDIGDTIEVYENKHNINNQKGSELLDIGFVLVIGLLTGIGLLLCCIGLYSIYEKITEEKK